MDESAQNQRRSEITLFASNGVGLSVRQRHSYIHVRLACVFLHFLAELWHKCQGKQLKSSDHQCYKFYKFWDTWRARRALLPARIASRLRSGCLASRDGAPLKSFLCFNALPLQRRAYVLVIMRLLPGGHKPVIPTLSYRRVHT